MPELPAKATPEQIDALYAAIGRALSQWAEVEDELCLLFCAAVHDENHSPCNEAYWAVASFEARLKMADVAIMRTTTRHPELKKRWGTLKNNLHDQNRKRNEVAHGRVLSISWHRGPKAIDRHDLFLAPYFHARRASNVPTHAEMMEPNYDPRPKLRLSHDDLVRRQKKFREISVNLRRWLQDFRKECAGSAV